MLEFKRGSFYVFIRHREIRLPVKFDSGVLVRSGAGDPSPMRNGIGARGGILGRGRADTGVSLKGVTGFQFHVDFFVTIGACEGV